MEKLLFPHGKKFEFCTGSTMIYKVHDNSKMYVIIDGKRLSRIYFICF